MFPVFSLGPFAIQVPLLMILVGVWAGIELSEKSAAFYNIDEKLIDGLIMTSFISGVIGARLFYLFQFPAVIEDSFMNALSLSPSMMDMSGGTLIFFLAAVIYGQRRHLGFWTTLDCLTPLLSLILMAISLANFASGDAYGIPSQMPWSIDLWATRRHPVQIYEMLAGLCIAIVVIPRFGVFQKIRRFFENHDGLSFLIFISLTSISRIFLEYFRADHSLYAGLVNSYQVVFWGVLTASLWGLLKRLS